jgi:hypothetical protein
LRQGNTGAPLPMTDDEPHSLFLLVDFLGLSDAELRIVRKFARHFPAIVMRLIFRNIICTTRFEPIYCGDRAHSRCGVRLSTGIGQL